MSDLFKKAGSLTLLLVLLFSLSVEAADEDNLVPSSTREAGLLEEIKHLDKLSQANKRYSDPKVQEEIRKAKTKLQELMKNNNNYMVVRINAFIPWDKLFDPINLYYKWHGDNRGFDVNATKSRLSQIIIYDLDGKEGNVVNFVGETIKYKTLTNKVVDGGLMNNEGMKVNFYPIQWAKNPDSWTQGMDAGASVRNPLHKVPIFRTDPPPIKWSYGIALNNHINSSTTIAMLSYSSSYTSFPAHESYVSINGLPYQVMVQYKPKLQFDSFSLLPVLDSTYTPVVEEKELWFDLNVGTISGVVLKDNHPISGAEITVKDLKEKKVFKSYSGQDGWYRFSLLEGDYKISISKKGYQDLIDTFSINKYNYTNKSFNLVKSK
ncbi:carboxypeptidase-like regulatory domain-containing protein [Priestia megaterium]|uniref:carboxypeptidase-like regulatory domain-containing protein n=1 Tax=Priestia megaterium TaxID=1404 RepID=UPI00317E2BA6